MLVFALLPFVDLRSVVHDAKQKLLDENSSHVYDSIPMEEEFVFDSL